MANQKDQLGFAENIDSINDNIFDEYKKLNEKCDIIIAKIKNRKKKSKNIK